MEPTEADISHLISAYAICPEGGINMAEPRERVQIIMINVFCGYCCVCNISNTRDSVSSGYPNTEKRVENTTHSGVFLTKFEVSG